MEHDLKVYEEFRSTDPNQFAFLLCSGFSILDLAGAIDTLSAANRVAGKRLFQWMVASVYGKAMPCLNGHPYPVESKCADIGKNAYLVAPRFNVV